jgi:hypothetical protein
VFTTARIPRCKEEKHRECWPTGFFARDLEGDPILVDRMGCLGTSPLPSYPWRADCHQFGGLCTSDLKRLRSEPLALDMSEMVRARLAPADPASPILCKRVAQVAYYVKTMEARRRLLFPLLSVQTKRLVTKYNTVVDLGGITPQHFGQDAIRFMIEMGKVFSDNYDDMCKSLVLINVPWWFHKVRTRVHQV